MTKRPPINRFDSILSHGSTGVASSNGIAPSLASDGSHRRYTGDSAPHARIPLRSRESTDTISRRSNKSSIAESIMSRCSDICHGFFRHRRNSRTSSFATTIDDLGGQTEISEYDPGSSTGNSRQGSYRKSVGSDAPSTSLRSRMKKVFGRESGSKRKPDTAKMSWSDGRPHRVDRRSTASSASRHASREILEQNLADWAGESHERFDMCRTNALTG
jgi:hypothetical protein